MKDKWGFVAMVVSSGFGTGFLPRKLPFFRPGGGGGMMGRLVALGIQFLFLYYGWGIWPMILAIAISFLLACLTIGPGEKFYLTKWGPTVRHTGKVTEWDFNHTNIDEIIGQFFAGLPFFLIPTGFWWNVIGLVVACAIFQYLDDKKPGGIGKIEENYARQDKRTFAVIYDDVAAGLISALLADILLLLASFVIYHVHPSWL